MNEAGNLSLLLVGGSYLAVSIALYKIGYLVGRQDGWRAGLKRGLEFGRLKTLEQDHNNHLALERRRRL